jgi:hypothetical protein
MHANAVSMPIAELSVADDPSLIETTAVNYLLSIDPEK